MDSGEINVPTVLKTLIANNGFAWKPHSVNANSWLFYYCFFFKQIDLWIRTVYLGICTC